MIIIVCCVAVLIFAWTALSIRQIRRDRAAVAYVGPLTPATPRPGPTTRQLSIRQRDVGIRNNDLVRVATIHARLSQEALQRAARVQRVWLGLQDPGSRLFPQEIRAPYWTYENAGADCYGFFLHVGLRLTPDTMPAMLAALEAETNLAPPGELCQSVQIETLEPMPLTHERRIFISSEYVKDGLLSVYERIGDNPSAQRMVDVMDNILTHSRHRSSAGLIPGTGSEENGNVLQAGSRLAYAFNRPDYADMAARIADAAVNQMLPRTGGMPVMGFDYVENKVVQARIKLRDHGSEITPGLTEAYAMAVARSDDPVWKDRADRWAEPLAIMFERIFQYGRNPQGVLVSALHPGNHKHLITDPNDNWGYLLNGVLLYTQAARRHGRMDPNRLDALERLVDQQCRAVAAVRDFAWQDGHMDGYADTLESAIYMARHRPTMASMLFPWIDDQMAQLYAFQTPDGFTGGTYLDGNFIRTVLMYADMRSGGWTVHPWREDVSVGFARNADGEAVVVVSASKPYTGTLRPDEPRHQTIMHLPWDWPRLNSWPEWFVIEDSMRVIEARGIETTPSISELRQGLRIDLPQNGKLILRLGTRPAP